MSAKCVLFASIFRADKHNARTIHDIGYILRQAHARSLYFSEKFGTITANAYILMDSCSFRTAMGLAAGSLPSARTGLLTGKEAQRNVRKGIFAQKKP